VTLQFPMPGEMRFFYLQVSWRQVGSVMEHVWFPVCVCTRVHRHTRIESPQESRCWKIASQMLKEARSSPH